MSLVATPQLDVSIQYTEYVDQMIEVLSTMKDDFDLDEKLEKVAPVLKSCLEILRQPSQPSERFAQIRPLRNLALWLAPTQIEDRVHHLLLVSLTYASALVTEMTIPESGGICFADMCLWSLLNVQHLLGLEQQDIKADKVLSLTHRIANTYERTMFGVVSSEISSDSSM
jgi:hypothetical protein